MSVDIVPHETQLVETMRNLFSTGYTLEKNDIDLANRLVQYGSDRTGLTEEEMNVLKKTGIMDADGTLIVLDEFFYKGIVLPSFWMKCLLAYHELMNFTGIDDEKDETPPQ